MFYKSYLHFLVFRKLLINCAVNNCCTTVPTVLPFWSGERSTGWHLNASGVISGVCRDTGADDILQGILEGIATRLDRILLALRAAGSIRGNISERMNTSTEEGVDMDSVPLLAASGGALEWGNDAFCQLIADVTGYTLVVANDDVVLDPSNQSADTIETWLLWLSKWLCVIGCKSVAIAEAIETTSLGVVVLMNEGNIVAPSVVTKKSGSSSSSSGSNSDSNSSSRDDNIRKYIPRMHMYTYYRKRMQIHHELYNSILDQH
jgi:hypothetical protein